MRLKILFPRIFIYPLLLCVSWGFIHAHPVHGDKEDAPKPLGNFSSLELPIRKVGNLILIKAEVDSVKGEFILDTGAPHLILNERYFKGFQIDKDKSAHDIAGARLPVQTVLIDSFRIADLYYEEVLADLTDLSKVEELRGVKILGALGVNLFLELELEIDLVSLRINIHRLSREGERLVVKDSRPAPEEGHLELPFKLRNNVMLVETAIGDESLEFCFDTGAEILVLSNKLSPKIFQQLQLVGCVQIAGASGSLQYVHYGRLPHIRIGKVYHNVNVVVANLTGLKRSYGNIDGILGYEFLAKDLLCINFVKQKIVMKEISRGVENIE